MIVLHRFYCILNTLYTKFIDGTVFEIRIPFVDGIVRDHQYFNVVLLSTWQHILSDGLQFSCKCSINWSTCQDSKSPGVIKLFPCSTQLSTNFILLINVKIPTIVGIFTCISMINTFILFINVVMPTIVGILTFISMINTTSEIIKARNFFICRYFSFYEQLKFRAQLS